MGYGAMQLAGPGVFGPPKDRRAALAVLREAIALGVNHIDTAASYGKSEDAIGPWMKRYRNQFFLATKTGDRATEGTLVAKLVDGLTDYILVRHEDAAIAHIITTFFNVLL